MKPRKANTLRELSEVDLINLLQEVEETYSTQTFQNSLKQLHDTSYLKILRGDIARIKTILNEKNTATN